MGRPSGYTQQVLDKATEYLQNYEKLGDEIPSNSGLAHYLDISRKTVQQWATEAGKEDFSDILEKIQQTQERILIAKGLNGTFNSNITKLVLGKHGYHDRSDITSNNETINFVIKNA